MVTLRRIGVRSAGRVGFWLGVALATVNIVVVLLFLLIVVQQNPPASFFVRALVFTFFSGVQSALMLGMMAFVYNLIARNYGGLELDFDMPGQGSDGEKRKNDDRADAGTDDEDDDDPDAKQAVEIV